MGKWKELAQPDDIHTCHADCQKPACVAVRQAASGKPQPESKVYSDIDEMFRDMGVPVTEQKPVAWRYALDASIEGPRWIYIDKDPHQWLSGPAMVGAVIEPIYTAPPQREWQGLTDEERYLNEARSAEEIEFARAIEAKLKEKNA